MNDVITMHVLDAATRLQLSSEGGFMGHTHPAYANMVGPFGGVTAACLLQAPLQHAVRIGEPIALTVNFAAALADGEFAVLARPLRTNRSTQHWWMELSQKGEVVASATAVFAVRKETWSAEDTTPPAPVPAAETIQRTEPIPGLAWTRHYDMRFVRGGLPSALDGQQQPDSVSQVWTRDEPPRPLDFISLTALCDSFFPRIFLRRRKRVPIGTVSLTTYFHADRGVLAAQDTRHLLGTARANAFRNGYFDQSAEIWGDDRRLLATSHQIVYYRE